MIAALGNQCGVWVHSDLSQWTSRALKSRSYIARTRAQSRRIHLSVSSASFHQDRLSASTESTTIKPPLSAQIRLAERDDELEASAWLRARSFYAYPPERKFAGELHQMMMADEEFKALKFQRMNRKLDQGRQEEARERSACLIAVCPITDLELEDNEQVDEKYILTDDGFTELALVGTLDICAVKAIEGEVLVGDCKNPAYLANVCTSPQARRRKVGQLLLEKAREITHAWGVDGVYVHTMAVNEIAVKFYTRNGFVVDKEETSNEAHYRGRCLDGIEGRGRTVLLRDTKF